MKAYIENEKKDSFKNIKNYLTPDWYETFKNKDLAYKKFKTLEIYRYFYRFSMEKLGRYSNSIYFMILMLFYLKNTKMLRLH